MKAQEAPQAGVIAWARRLAFLSVLAGGAAVFIWQSVGLDLVPQTYSDTEIGKLVRELRHHLIYGNNATQPSDKASGGAIGSGNNRSRAAGEEVDQHWEVKANGMGHKQVLESSEDMIGQVRAELKTESTTQSPEDDTISFAAVGENVTGSLDEPVGQIHVETTSDNPELSAEDGTTQPVPTENDVLAQPVAESPDELVGQVRADVDSDRLAQSIAAPSQSSEISDSQDARSALGASSPSKFMPFTMVPKDLAKVFRRRLRPTLKELRRLFGVKDDKLLQHLSESLTSSKLRPEAEWWASYPGAAPPKSVAKPPEKLVLFHAYWAKPAFGAPQIFSLRSFAATQDLSHCRVVIWINSKNFQMPPQLDPLVKLGILELRQLDTMIEFHDSMGSDHIERVKSFLMDPSLSPYAVDWARYIVLATFGGVWFDLDVAFLKDMLPLMSYEWAYPWGEYRIDAPRGRILNADFMRLRKGSEVTVDLLKRVANESIPNGQMGLTALQASRKHPDLNVLSLDLLDLGWQSKWKEHETLLAPLFPKNKNPDNWFMLGFFHDSPEVRAFSVRAISQERAFAYHCHGAFMQKGHQKKRSAYALYNAWFERVVADLVDPNQNFVAQPLSEGLDLPPISARSSHEPRRKGLVRRERPPKSNS